MEQLDGRGQRAVATESGEQLRRRGWFWALMVPLFAVGSVPAYFAVLGAYFLATGQEFDAPTPAAVDALAWVTSGTCYLTPLVAALRCARRAARSGAEAGLLVLAAWALAVLSLALVPVAIFFFGVLFVSGTPSFEEAPLFMRGGVAGVI